MVWLITYNLTKKFLKKRFDEKKKIKLGVNIDHIATLRNARNENFPDIKTVAEILHKVKVDSITVHLERIEDI